MTTIAAEVAGTTGVGRKVLPTTGTARRTSSSSTSRRSQSSPGSTATGRPPGNDRAQRIATASGPTRRRTELGDEPLDALRGVGDMFEPSHSAEVRVVDRLDLRPYPAAGALPGPRARS